MLCMHSYFCLVELWAIPLIIGGLVEFYMILEGGFSPAL